MAKAQLVVAVRPADDRWEISHYDAFNSGTLDVNGWVGTDTNGYNFVPEMLSATDEGKWVTYVFANPETGDFGSGYTGWFELKNASVVRHDGLVFGSGWYVSADAFTRALVATAARVFREAGLEGTIAYFANPQTDFAGLHAPIAYYNTAEDVAGEWSAFVADESGTVIDHFHKEMVGKSLADVLGRHGQLRGHRGGQLGHHGVPARLGARPGRDDLRLRLAQRPRRAERLSGGGVKGGGILGHGAEQQCTSRASMFSENVTLRRASAGAVSRGVSSAESRRRWNRRLRVCGRLACSA